MNVPEIVNAVLAQVDHPRTLLSCALVNHSWHQDAEKLLWHGADHSDIHSTWLWETPGLGVLQRLAQVPERCRHYISLIKHLHIMFGDFEDTDNGSLWQESIWEDARFVSVRVDIGSFNMSEERMAYLLQPELRCLMLFGKALCTAFPICDSHGY